MRINQSNNRWKLIIARFLDNQYQINCKPFKPTGVVNEPSEQPFQTNYQQGAKQEFSQRTGNQSTTLARQTSEQPFQTNYQQGVRQEFSQPTSNQSTTLASQAGEQPFQTNYQQGAKQEFSQPTGNQSTANQSGGNQPTALANKPVEQSIGTNYQQLATQELTRQSTLNQSTILAGQSFEQPMGISNQLPEATERQFGKFDSITSGQVATIINSTVNGSQEHADTLASNENSIYIPETHLVPDQLESKAANDTLNTEAILPNVNAAASMQPDQVILAHNRNEDSPQRLLPEVTIGNVSLPTDFIGNAQAVNQSVGLPGYLESSLILGRTVLPEQSSVLGPSYNSGLLSAPGLGNQSSLSPLQSPFGVVSRTALQNDSLVVINTAKSLLARNENAITDASKSLSQLMQGAMQPGKGTESKSENSDKTFPLSVKLTGLIAIFEINPSGTKKSKLVQMGESDSLTVWNPIVLTTEPDEGSEIDETVQSEEPNPSAANGLIITAAAGAQVPVQAAQGLTTNTTTQQTTANTDPNTGKSQTSKSKDPHATDTKSLMGEFTDDETLLTQLGTRKEIAGNFVDVDTEDVDDYTIDNSDLDIGGRTNSSRFGASNTSTRGTSLLQILLVLLDDLKGKKKGDKTEQDILFDAMFGVNDQKEYVVKKGDTLGSIAYWKYKHRYLARRIYQENVSKKILKPIKNEQDLDAISDIEPQPGTKLILPSGSQSFRYKCAHKNVFNSAYIILFGYRHSGEPEYEEDSEYYESKYSAEKEMALMAEVCR